MAGSDEVPGLAVPIDPNLARKDDSVLPHAGIRVVAGW
jgi:hypothetical protein